MTEISHAFYGAAQSPLHKNDESENTSGLGKYYPTPDGVKGWSWGAFTFSWLWAINNKTWIGLLAGIPIVGIVVRIALGMNGREWAWQNRRWGSLEEFTKAQKRWSIWGVGMWLIFASALTVSIVVSQISENQIKAQSLTALKFANEVAEKVGNYVQKNRSLPRNIQEAGVEQELPIDVQHVAINQKNGFLSITTNISKIKGQAFFLAPSFESNGQIVWRCLHGDIPKNYLPPECRFDSADNFHIP